MILSELIPYKRAIVVAAKILYILCKPIKLISNKLISELLSLKIEDEILEEDKEMIEDLVVAAVNQALHNATKAADEKMSSATGGMMGNMKIPGI